MNSEVTIAAADPMNLIGIVIPGDRPIALPGRTVTYRNGQLKSEVTDAPQPETMPIVIDAAHYLHPAPSLFASDTGT